MYTEKEKQIAQEIISNKEMCDLLHKVFFESDDKLSLEIVLSKNNEELGEIVKADTLATQKILSRWAKLKQLGQKTSGAVKKVPK